MGSAISSDKHSDQPSTELLIRSVMIDQKRTNSRDRLPELEPVDDEQVAAANVEAPQAKSAKPKKASDWLSLKTRVRGYRPTRKHIVLAVLALVVVLRPWLIPGILFITFWVGLIVWLTLGPDRMAEWGWSAWHKLCARKPALAEDLRLKADAFALRFDAFLEKLPSKWAEKLALPDLSNTVQPEEDLSERTDPFERLKLPEVYRG